MAVKAVKDNFLKAVEFVKNWVVGKKVLDDVVWIAAKSTTVGKVLSGLRMFGGVLSIVTGIPTAVMGGMKAYNSVQDCQWDNTIVGGLDVVAGTAATGCAPANAPWGCHAEVGHTNGNACLAGYRIAHNDAHTSGHRNSWPGGDYINLWC